MLKILISFTLNLFYWLFAVFFVHIITHKFFYNEYSLIMAFSYIFNFIIATFIYYVTNFFSKKNINNSIVFFLAASLLKIFLFYLLLYPFFISDGSITKDEIFVFFIPYTISSIYQIERLSNQLNTKK